MQNILIISFIVLNESLNNNNATFKDLPVSKTINNKPINKKTYSILLEYLGIVNISLTSNLSLILINNKVNKRFNIIA